MKQLIDLKRDMSTESYEQFIDKINGDDPEWIFKLNNVIIRNCVELGFINGMTENETLRAAIISLVKIHDDETQRKMQEALYSRAPFNYLKR